jgi:hypothetical protein
MRKLIIVAFGMALAFVAPRAFAHEGHDHAAAGDKVMGTVSAVHKDMNHIEVKDKAGKIVGISVNDKTMYMKGKAMVKLDDVKVGARVVVTVTGEGDQKTATKIQLSSGKAAASGSMEGAHGDESKAHQH